MKSLNKTRIIVFLICSLLINQIAFAGQFFFDSEYKIKYLDDSGNIVTGWRWIDTNNDNIAECYRFADDGTLVASSSGIKGKKTDAEGRWIVDGVVQQIYKSTGKPLYATNAGFGENDTNEYFDLDSIMKATDSEATNSNVEKSNLTRRINATSKDIKSLMMADLNADEEARKRSLMGPDGIFEGTEEGYILSKGASTKINNRPIATKNNVYIIDDALKEEEVRYLSASESIVAGKDMRKFVSASNKYKEKVDGAKVYGGYVWDDCICLQGNDAYVKFTLTDDKSKFHANYFTFEVAHQTHGESTADTSCILELYLNGKSVTTYDEFCDGEPELVEEWLDDGETNMELRAVITGDAPGRKVYIRNMRFRQIKEKKDD